MERDEYGAWKLATFGSDYMIWHDGLNTGAVTELVGDARARAVQMLRLGVDIGDSHAAEALAAMGESSSVEALRALLARSRGEDRVRVALAIHRLGSEPSLAAHLVDVLRGPLHWGERMAAAIGLRHFDGRNDELALLDAVEHDAEYLVRYHAAESLLARFRVPARLPGHPAIFDCVARRSGTLAQARQALERVRPRRPWRLS